MSGDSKQPERPLPRGNSETQISTPPRAEPTAAAPAGPRRSRDAVASVGSVLGSRWSVGERIGMGGMASVHRGVDLRLDRPVAVKILHAHIAESADSRIRLAREARAIAQLNHESVIEVYDYDSSDADSTWLITELVEGGSLGQFLGTHPKLMPEIAVMVVQEVVRALAAAHAVGVVHRDVKPDNVLIGKNGRPKLSDFGIAQIASAERVTITGSLVGSPSYMSPEQAEGRRTDHRTDLFSAGVMLYRLVTGRLPFGGENAIDTLRKVAALDCPDPAEIEPGLPAPIAGVIRRAMSRTIDARYQSAAEMLADLSEILRDAGLIAVWDELPRFFLDPVLYEHLLLPRLASELTARGRAHLDSGLEARALDCLNRAASLGPVTNERTLDLVRMLSHRRDRGRLRRMALAAIAAVGAIALAAVGLRGFDVFRAKGDPGTVASGGPNSALAEPPNLVVPETPLQAWPITRSAEQRAELSDEGAISLSAATVMPPNGAKSARRAANAKAPDSRKLRPDALRPVEATVVAPEPPPPPAPTTGVLQIGSSRWVDLFVDGEKIGRAPDQSRYTLAVGEHRLSAVNPHCAPLDRPVTIRPGETTRVRLEIRCP